MRDTLTIDYCGDVSSLQPGEELTFGRTADLVVDDNRYLHRLLGRFAYEGDRWWLHNTGRTITLSVVDTGSRNRFRVTPGSHAALTLAQGVIRFEAGPTTYELRLAISQPQPTRSPVTERIELRAVIDNVTETISVTDLEIIDTEWPILVALAEPMLTDPTADRLAVPTNRKAALRLGLRMPQFNRSLDRLCAKLAELGVDGLSGDTENGLAYDRRVRLVQWALDHRLVTPDDIASLPAGGPGSEAS